MLGLYLMRPPEHVMGVAKVNSIGSDHRELRHGLALPSVRGSVCSASFGGRVSQALICERVVTAMGLGYERTCGFVANTCWGVAGDARTSSAIAAATSAIT